jgi:anti-sigma B factor antagonist
LGYRAGIERGLAWSRARTRDASVKYSLSNHPGHTAATAGPAPLALEFESGDGRPLRAIVTGEIDFAGAPSMQAQIASACARHDEHALVLDLSAVQFMDSSGLRAVLHVQRDLSDEPGGGMVILDATEPVRKLLKLTGLERHLRVFDTLEQAETALAEGTRDEAESESQSADRTDSAGQSVDHTDAAGPA